MRFTITSICCLLLLFTACHTHKKVSRSTTKLPEKPSWITNRPVANGYYTGIGVAQVNNYTGNHIDLAKNNALNDIVSEISVTISSNSVIRQFENNAEYKEEFESFSNATIRDNIEGYELVDSWGDDQHYWVYYRLSKDVYRAVKERKLERAKALAYDFYEKAQISEKNGDIANAISFNLKALNALRYHLDEELTLLTDKGKIYLANEILASVIELFSKMEIQCDQSDVYAKIAKPIDSTFTFTAFYKSASGTMKAVNNLPFRVFFRTGAGELTPSAVTNQQGVGTFRLGRITGNQNFQEITVEIDVRSMMESNDDQSALLGELINLKSAVPACRVNLMVAPLVAIYEVSEIEYGKRSARNAMTNEIRKYLAANFFTFTNQPETADVRIVLDTRTVQGNFNEMHNVYTVFMDCYLSIYDVASGNKVYYKGFDQVRGQQVGSWENSLKDAQLNTLKRIREEILPEIHQLDF